MKYFTEIKIPESPSKIDYSTKIVLLGSCFTENIGEKLMSLKFQIDLNPFGILYNPVSIASSLEILLDQKLMVPDDLFINKGVWQSFFHHGRFASATQEEALEKMNSRITEGYRNLAEAGFLFITFGTAWVYEHISTGRVVSNCHKIEAGQFRRYRLEVSQIVSAYLTLIKRLREINPEIKIVFTVSPIRHWKDGAVENQISKATLIVAINRILEEANDINTGYFPSYEIVMDELRDYRFYAGDMLHLSEVAITHIWERFSDTYLRKEIIGTINELKKIAEATSHRPIYPESDEFKGFVKNHLNKVNELALKFPSIDLTKERAYFEKLL